MAIGDDAPAEQILIIRRKSSGEDEGHHGGVWKIAYADFMTAMMAFFLVMWLINAANTETKAKVASYFNPLKLMDSSSKKKGLQDLDEKTKPADSPGASAGSGKEPGNAAKSTDASQQAPSGPSSGPSSGGVKSVTMDPAAAAAEQHGRAFRDPFNPLSPPRLAERDGRIAKDGVEHSANTAPPVVAHAPAASPGSMTAADKPAAIPSATESSDTAAEMVASQAAKSGSAAQRMAATAAGVLRDVQAASRQVGLTGGPGIDVTVEPDGIVISLTDTSTFGMFGIGSADANIALVALLQKIVPVLAANSQSIIVRGHTDSRPFKTDKNNNWRLSMSRAEAASAILTRSGIDEARIERIEAHANRRLKTPNDPEAAANRRIEILLRPAAVP